MRKDTAYLEGFIDGYIESFDMMQEDPDVCDEFLITYGIAAPLVKQRRKNYEREKEEFNRRMHGARKPGREKKTETEGESKILQFPKG